jgi:hypothetical protein
MYFFSVSHQFIPFRETYILIYFKAYGKPFLGFISMVCVAVDG